MTAPKPDPVHDARQALLAKLDSIEGIVTLTHEDLVVIALASTAATHKADYLTLTDAQPGAQPAPFECTELGAGGKQNRVINVTVWLAPNKTTPISVSCLEHGRRNSGRVFCAGLPVALDFRAKVGRMVNDRSGLPASAAARDRYAADHGAVWRAIALKET